MAANGMAVRCGQAIARVPIAKRSVASAHAACGAGLLVTGDGRARQAGELHRHFGCRLLKRMRNSEEWLRWLCFELLREKVAYRLEEDASRAIRIVDGTIVREPGKTGSQWRILYSIRLPSLVCVTSSR